MPIELKPCPFCGGEAKYIELIRCGTDSSGYVKCGKPLPCCEQPRVRNKKFAVKAWNRRADDATD